MVLISSPIAVLLDHLAARSATTLPNSAGSGDRNGRSAEVEFDHARVIDYQPGESHALSEAILRYERLVYEATTDNQTEAALTNLVPDHFAILKVRR